MVLTKRRRWTSSSN